MEQVPIGIYPQNLVSLAEEMTVVGLLDVAARTWDAGASRGGHVYLICCGETSAEIWTIRVLQCIKKCGFACGRVDDTSGLPCRSLPRLP